MRRFLPALAGLVLAVALGACAQANGSSPSGPAASADPNSPTVVANGLKFEQSTVNVPAGAAFTLVFDNKDGAPHNIAIAKDQGFGQKVFEGEVFSGPSSKVYSVDTLAAGTYYFRCDVHPDMQGTIVAK